MSKQKKIIILIVALIVIPCIVLGFLYLSSIFFLFFAKLKDVEATFTTILEYKKHYGHDPYTMKIVKQAFTLASIVVSAPFIFLLVNKLKKPKRELYGKSRLATKQEALTKLSEKNFGVLCGHIKPTYLLFGGTQHILMEAPSRSGKGVGFVVPNCLNYDGSIVVLDIKGENFDITSEFRRLHGHKVFMFNPAPNAVIDKETGEYKYFTHRWNFLGYISDNENERINDIQKIADQLFPDGDSGNAFFQQQGRSIFLAIVLYLFDTPELSITPGEAFRQCLRLADKEYFARECDKRIEEHKSDNSIRLINPIADRNFRAYAALSDNTASSVMGTVTARLEMWANPIIDAATSANDFDLRKLRREKTAIYFVVTPDNIKRFAFIVNLFFQQCFDLNLRELPQQNPDLKYPCLFLLDEFTSIGEIETISRGIAYFAGYNLRLAIIIQSIAQLTAVYGEAVKDTFVTNLALRIVFAPKENKVAQEISESLGYITESNLSTSKSKNKGGDSKSESQSAVKRALFWPHELKDIGPEKQILILDDIPPVICNKIRYYKDDNFLKRLKGATKIPQLEILDADFTPIELPKKKVEQVIETKIVETAEDIENITAQNVNISNFNYEDEDLGDFGLAVEEMPNATHDEKKAIADKVSSSLINLLFKSETSDIKDSSANSETDSGFDEDELINIALQS